MDRFKQKRTMGTFERTCNQITVYKHNINSNIFDLHYKREEKSVCFGMRNL